MIEPLSNFGNGAPAGEFWACVIFGAVAGVAMITGAFVYLSRKRVIENTPTAKIRSAPQGYLELQGHADLRLAQSGPVGLMIGVLIVRKPAA